MRRTSKDLPDRQFRRWMSIPTAHMRPDELSFLNSILLTNRRRSRRLDFKQEPIRSASGRMLAILAEKDVTGVRATWAVKATLELAAKVNLEEPRRDLARSRIAAGHRAAKELCRRLDAFVVEVAELNHNSKRSLNECIDRALSCGQFDTEIFFSVLEGIEATLSHLSVNRRSNLTPYRRPILALTHF
jgi:hypothetical protein